MALLRRVRDIDIVLGGHDHELRVWYDGRQAILKSRSQGRYVGILNLALDRELGQAIGRTPVELDTRGPVVRSSGRRWKMASAAPRRTTADFRRWRV